MKIDEGYNGSYKTVTLEKENIRIDKYIHILCDSKFTIERVNHMKDLMLVRLNDYVWTEHLCTDEQVVEHPATWWDHFKRDAIPTFTKWFKLKVKMSIHKITFNRKAIYPTIKYKRDDSKMSFVIHEKVERITDERRKNNGINYC